MDIGSFTTIQPMKPMQPSAPTPPPGGNIENRRPPAEPQAPSAPTQTRAGTESTPAVTQSGRAQSIDLFA